MKHGGGNDLEGPVKSTLVFKRRQYSTGAQQIGPRPLIFKHGIKAPTKGAEHSEHRSPVAEAATQPVPPVSAGLGLHHYYDPRHRQSTPEDNSNQEISVTTAAVLQQQHQLLQARLQKIQEQKQRCMAMLLSMPAHSEQRSTAQNAVAAADYITSSARPAVAVGCDSPQHSSQSQLSRHSLLRQTSAEAGTSIHTIPRQYSAEGPLSLRDNSEASLLSRGVSQHLGNVTAAMQGPAAIPNPANFLAALAALTAPAPPPPAPVIAQVVQQAPTVAAEPCPSAAELALLQQLLLAVSAAESSPELAKQVEAALLQLQQQPARQPASVPAVDQTAALPVVLQLLQTAAVLLNGSGRGAQ